MWAVKIAHANHMKNKKERICAVSGDAEPGVRAVRSGAGSKESLDLET